MYLVKVIVNYETTLVHGPLSDENRGHQMLVKMGWQKGQGLGKDNMGVAELVARDWAGITRVLLSW